MNKPRLLCWSTTTSAAAAMTLWAGEVQAFFPPLPIASDPPSMVQPPGSSPVLINPITNEPLVIQPINPIVVPPVPPPPFTPPPVPSVPQVVPPCVCVPNPPQHIPEPATIGSALVGLGLLAISRKRLRKSIKKGNEQLG